MFSLKNHVIPMMFIMYDIGQVPLSLKSYGFRFPRWMITTQ